MDEPHPAWCDGLFVKVLNIIGTFRFTGYRRSLKKSFYYAQAPPETWHPPLTHIINNV